MKIMIDTNIFLDVLLNREPFVDASARLLDLCEDKNVMGYVPASCITDIFYIVKKYTHSNDQAYFAIGKVMDIASICSVTVDEVLAAYQSKSKDFEDRILAECAKTINCRYIITRNKPDYEGYGVSVLTPDEFLNA